MPALFPIANQILLTSASSLQRGEWVSWISKEWSKIIEWLVVHYHIILEWISQPHVYAIIIAWAITFTIIATLLLTLGFGPFGVGAGSLAAWFQATMYGGFTPAGGIFATLTSLAMLGLLMPVIAVPAAFVATIVALIVWAIGVGR